MKVRFTRDAESDLEAIADYIAVDSPRHAIQQVLALREAALGLNILAKRFPAVDVVGNPLRRRPKGQYLIYYLIEDETVHIMRVLHSARDQVSELFPDD